MGTRRPPRFQWCISNEQCGLTPHPRMVAVEVRTLMSCGYDSDQVGICVRGGLQGGSHVEWQPACPLVSPLVSIQMEDYSAVAQLPTVPSSPLQRTKLEAPLDPCLRVSQLLLTQVQISWTTFLCVPLLLVLHSHHSVIIVLPTTGGI